MDVIPVIDVRHGLAVAAVRGQRADYRPLVTPLAEGSDAGRYRARLRGAVYLPGAVRRRPRRHRGPRAQRRLAGASRRRSAGHCAYGSTTARARAPPRSASPTSSTRPWSSAPRASATGKTSPPCAPCRTTATCCRSISRTTVSSARATVLDEPQHWPPQRHRHDAGARRRLAKGLMCNALPRSSGALAAGVSMPPEACATAPTSKRCTPPAPPACSIATALHAGTIKADDLEEIAGL